MGESGRLPAECQLPLDINDFTGRDEELARLLSLLTAGTGVPVVVISGPPGMGKSALAVRAGHLLIKEYPDGQWFLRLNGAGAPRDPADLLAELLRTAGVDPAAIPDQVDARSTLLRSRLADRKVLLLLDDAGSAEQVAPLLPGRPGSAVLVTSRSDLIGLSVLYGGVRVPVEPLAAAQARELFVRMAGPDRCAKEEPAVAEVIELCGRLPLALRIAAANLASRTGLSIRNYADDLKTGDRLAKLATRGEHGPAVRAAFDLSYVNLRPAEQRGFRLLGLVAGPDIGADGAAALLACPVDEATGILDRLAAANLIESQHKDRFRFHDLLRMYAAARAEAEEPGTEQALRRLHDWYLHSAHAATTRSLASLYISPLPAEPVDIVPATFESVADALSWLDAERASLIAAATHAGPPYTWLITDALRPDLHVRYRVAELEELARLGLRAARGNGDQRAEAAMLLADGGVKAITGRFREAVTISDACRELAAGIGQTEIETAARLQVAAAFLELGQPESARQAVSAVARQAIRPIRRASVLLCLGEALIDLDELAEAENLLNEALSCAEQSVSQIHAALAHRLLGDVLRETGDFEGALRHFTAAFDVAVYRENRPEEPMLGLASIYRDTGHLDLALDYSQSAAQAAHQVGHQRYEADALVSLGSVHARAGNVAAAMDSYLQAREMATQLGHVRAEVEALTGMASAGLPQAAVEAVTLARRHGLRLLEKKALQI
jgi:tetratricopeptide (TPR) repeat protein